MVDLELRGEAMAVWLTEQEFQSDVELSENLSINVAFMYEIKDDHVELRSCFCELDALLLGPVSDDLAAEHARVLVDLLHRLRDSLETYFALEEFYGYFRAARITNAKVATESNRLCQEHEILYLNACRLVEYGERILYGRS